MNYDYALMAVVMTTHKGGRSGEMDVIHFCHYDHKPTDEDKEALAKRLREETRYGLVGRTDYQIVEAMPGMVQYYGRLNPADEDAYYVDQHGEVLKS